MEKYGKEKQHLGLESQRDRLMGEAEREGDRATAKQKKRLKSRDKGRGTEEQ